MDKKVIKLQDIERYMVKLKRKLKRVDLDYTVQASINSTEPTVVVYGAMLTSPAKGLAPISFIADTAENMIEQLKKTIKAVDYLEVEKAYHKAQIKSCKNTIVGHEERLAEIEKEQEESTEETKEDKEEQNG